MEKTLGYIFGCLQLTEAAIGEIAKNFKKQNGINKLTAISLLGCGYCIYLTMDQCEKNKKKIEELTKEVEELNKSKGE